MISELPNLTRSVHSCKLEPSDILLDDADLDLKYMNILKAILVGKLDMANLDHDDAVEIGIRENINQDGLVFLSKAIVVSSYTHSCRSSLSIDTLVHYISQSRSYQNVPEPNLSTVLNFYSDLELLEVGRWLSWMAFFDSNISDEEALKFCRVGAETFEALAVVCQMLHER